MLFESTLFIGVDPSGGRKPFTYAAFDRDAKLVSLANGEMEDVLAFLTGQSSAFVAVNAPSRPNKGIVRNTEIRQSLPPLHQSGRSMDMRLAEHQLRERGINVSTTPSRRELCSNWVQVGFEFYRKLDTAGYKMYSEEGASHQWIETHPHACFCVLLGQNPLPRPTLEGRLQRQLALYEQGMDILDPMEFFEEVTRYKLLKGTIPQEKIYMPEELDALAAAYTAYTLGLRPEEVSMVGNDEEGRITLPNKDLKPRY